MADNKRQWVGKGKQVANYPLVNINLCLSDIPQNAIDDGKNGKKYVNLTIGENKDGANEWGYTHSIWVNDYKPDASAKKPVVAGDDLPF